MKHEPTADDAGRPTPDPWPLAPGPHDGVEWEPGLVEEAVVLAIRAHPDEAAFRRERDRLYEVRDPEEREIAFRRLHAAWFEGLELAAPIQRALGERPSIGEATSGCLVAPARVRKAEGAELFVRPAAEGLGERERRRVVIRLSPEAWRDPDRLLGFLRHELLHIADMLDPPFGYEPHLPPSGAGPAHDRLLRDRYRTLWDATIDGRLARLAQAPASTRADRLRDFARAFPMLGDRTEETFQHFFENHACTHGAFVAFAANPSPAVHSSSPDPRPPAPGAHIGERCPLCRFPTYAFEADPEALPGEVLAEIARDFPAWAPAHGLCRQCADLYRSRRPLRAGDSAVAAA
jgi:hypothetical protein